MLRSCLRVLTVDRDLNLFSNVIAMDPATYEHLRNKTLLFFIEKLLDPSHGNNNNNANLNSNVMYTNKRTLHDLSCQFGSKGFTKEMRQIAGGSQSGLKKFLSTYPSIFKIDGDMVSYNVNSSLIKNPGVVKATGDNEGEVENANVTSIDNEAVEYFRERLMQYGLGIWVPIKSLLGHRSQAPPHIRHVSGQHIREFTQFLSKYPETFIINAQDEVLLKEFENYYNENANESPDKQLVDKRRIVELIEFYGNCLSERGPMLVEQLFCAGNAKYDGLEVEDGVWENFKTPSDLSTFFKMYPQCFQVHSNLVTFSDSYKVGLEYLKRQTGCVTVTTPPPVQILKPLPPKPKPEPTLPPSPKKEVKKESPPQPAPPQPQKSLLKQRVSKILMQAINQNTEHDYKHDTGSPGIVLSPTSQPAMPLLQQHATQFNSLCESGDTEELRAYILSRTTIVSNQRKAGQIIDEILGAKEPVSVDFEGINLGNDGQITLVQVGTTRGSVFIFDVLTQPGLIEGGEKSLLGRLLCGDNGVVKVMHDCRNDSVNLFRQFGVKLSNVFDTQVAHIVIQMGVGGGGGEEEEDGGRGKGGSSKNISLNNLCSVYGTVCNPFKDKVKSVYRHDQKYWSRRPLTKQMIAYASCDVMCLVPSVYETLKNQVGKETERLALFHELCEEQILTHIEPEEIRSRRRLRKNESDLRALREKLDRAFSEREGASNSSLVLSNREMRLLKHLHLTDEEKEKLKLSLKVAKKLEKMSSSALGGSAQHSLTSSDCYAGNVSQGALSSDSTSNSELTSLEYTENNAALTDPRIAQIDSLEAIINRLINDNSSGGEEKEEGDVKRNYRDCCTQTISTGDIVITKVFDD